MALIDQPKIAALIERIATGDQIAFEQLYHLTKPILAQVCFRVLRDWKEVEDALQEVFVKIWKNADRFAAARNATLGWLITIARRHAYDVLRAKGRSPAGAITEGFLFDLLVDPAPSPEAAMLGASDLSRIALCFDRLPAKKAEAVRGAYIEGQSYIALAERHHIPLNTMRSRLRRGLIEMRETFEREDL